MNLDIGLEDPWGVSLDQQRVVKLFKGESTLRLVGSLSTKSFKNLHELILGEFEAERETSVDEIVLEHKSYIFGIICLVGFLDGHI